MGGAVDIHTLRLTEEAAIGGSLVGAAGGAITGLALVWVLRHPKNGNGQMDTPVR